jgi:hypothetical protein
LRVASFAGFRLPCASERRKERLWLSGRAHACCQPAVARLLPPVPLAGHFALVSCRLAGIHRYTCSRLRTSGMRSSKSCGMSTGTLASEAAVCIRPRFISKACGGAVLSSQEASCLAQPCPTTLSLVPISEGLALPYFLQVLHGGQQGDEGGPGTRRC